MNTIERVQQVFPLVSRRIVTSILPHSVTYVLLGLGILFVDMVTSQFLLPFMLCVVPVALAAWFARSITAYVLSLLLPTGSLSIVLFWEHSAPLSYAVLNSLIQVGVLAFVAIAAGTIRQNVELKRQVKLLQSILPVCMGCKRIRDGHEHWQPLEVYVTENTDSVVSHGLCQECARNLYGEYLEG
jgi:hypothetical protein